jgi:hypothetical protein
MKSFIWFMCLGVLGGFLNLGCSSENCVSESHMFCSEGINYGVDSCGNIEETLGPCDCGCLPDHSGCATCGCDGLPNGTQETRTRYEAASVPAGLACQAEEQTRICQSGDWTGWSGSYVHETCTRSPLANAGPDQTVQKGDSVALDGSASSDPEGATLSYTWTQVSGTSISLTNGTTATPSFVAPHITGPVVFRLVVDDGQVQSMPDDVTITIANQTPTAVAGPDQIVAKQDLVSLNGTGSSDPDGDSLTYTWTQLSGGSVTLSSRYSDRPSFTAPNVTGDVVLQLVVSDEAVSSAADTVTITITNLDPTTNAGPDQIIYKGDLATLDGTLSSDPDNDVLNYAWTQTAGTTVTLSDPAAASPTFTVPSVIEDLEFSLVVSDDVASAPADSVTLSIVNRAPVADAGTDQTVYRGHPVTLDATASSDPDSEPLSYSWTQVSGTGVSLSSPSAAQPTFTAPNGAFTLEFSVTVNDGFEDSTADTVTVEVLDQSVPIADSGIDQDVEPMTTVMLDGSASYDPDGAELTYAWVQTNGPDVDLDDDAAERPTFVSPNVDATLTFELTVHNGSNPSAPDQAEVSVFAWNGQRATVGGNPFKVELDLGGQIRRVVKQGDYVYLIDDYYGIRSYLRRVDVSDPRAPVEVDEFQFSGTAHDLAVVGNYVYVVESIRGLVIFDTTDPVELTLVNEYDINFSLEEIEVIGTTAYVIERNDGLYIIDISDPMDPIELGQADPSTFYNSLIVGDGYAYTSTSFNDYIAIDVSTAGEPVTVAQASLFSGEPNYFALSGTDLHMCVDGDVYVYDVSTPADPQLLGSYTVPRGALTVTVDGNISYVAGYESGLHILDISDLANPVEIGSYDTDAARHVAVDDGWAYVADGYAGLRIIDVHTPAMPMTIGTVVTDGPAGGVAVSGDYAYVAQGVSGLAIINIVDPFNPSLQISHALAGEAVKVTLFNGLAFVAAMDGGLQIVDVTDPQVPVQEGSCPTTGTPVDVVVDADWAYVADMYESFSVVNISDTQNPVLAINYPTSSNSTVGVAKVDDIVYLAEDDPDDPDIGIRILDVTDPLVPVQEAFHVTPGDARGVTVVNGIAYVADLDMLQIVDVSTPSAPVALGQLNTAAYLIRVAVDGRYAYLAEQAGGLSVVDVSDPSDPVFVAQYSTPGLANDVVIFDGFAYVADDDEGLHIFDTPETAINLLDNYGIVDSGSVLTYSVAWADRYPTADEAVICQVTAGTCQVTLVDQASATATLEWTLPNVAGDEELGIVVGNDFHFVGAYDRIRIE